MIAVKARKERAEQNKTTGSQDSVRFYGILGDYSNFAHLDSERNSTTGRQGIVTVLLLLVKNHAGVVVCQKKSAEKKVPRRKD
jgi:hypothetical protein